MRYMSLNRAYEESRKALIGLSKRHLTELIKSGLIPSLKSGKKILVDWDQVMLFLASPSTEPFCRKQAGGNEIRAVR